jgi:adenylyltransferase/sulfurtransferase
MPGPFTEVQFRRYARHIVLAEVGGEGQRRLMDARVLIVGAGGLGSPAALYLAAAGVGTLGICDDDAVDLSNLQRQILHGTPDVGRRKTDSAAAAIARVNPDVRVEDHALRLDAGQANLLASYDVVLDGSDNFETKFLLNDAALVRGVPLVIAGILRFSGQLMTVRPGTACYRCVFEEPPPPDVAPSCQAAGVLGAVAGVMGSLQAVEALKLILGRGSPMTDRILVYDALSATFRELQVSRRPECSACNFARKFDTPPSSA